MRSKPLVLVVDDIPKNVQVVANILAQRNYDISAAFSGTQALDMIPKKCPRPDPSGCNDARPGRL